MKRKSATRQPAPRATVSSPAPAGTAPQERARQGNMQLAELMSCANELQSRGLAEESARLYQEWIAHTQSPHRHVACFNWGAVLGALNRHAEAEKAYRQALQMKPDFVQARLNLGHQLEHLGRIDEALAQWQQVWDWPFADSPVPDTDLRLHAINNRARLLEQQRRLDEAEACLVQSLELKPEQPDVHAALRAHPPEAMRMAGLPAGGRGHRRTSC